MANLTTPSDLMALLEIEFDEITPRKVSGSVAADERHHQPWGVVHGGLFTTVIETFATTGAYETVKEHLRRQRLSPPTEHGAQRTRTPCAGAGVR